MSISTTGTIKDIQLATARSDVSVPEEMNLHKIGPQPPSRAVSCPVSTERAALTPTGDGGKLRNRTVSALSSSRGFRNRYRPFSATFHFTNGGEPSNRTASPLSGCHGFQDRCPPLGAVLRK